MLTRGAECQRKGGKQIRLVSSMFAFGGAFCLYVSFWTSGNTIKKKDAKTRFGQPYNVRISCLTEHIVEAQYWWSLLDLAFHKHIIGQKLWKAV